MPKIVQLSCNHYAVVFSLMKLVPAAYIIEKAIANGMVTPKTRIIESSSGTFAKGLAMVCNLKGLKLTIVSDNVIDAAYKSQLEDLGAEIDIVEAVEGRGIQFVRLERLEQLKQRYPDHYWTRQYDNPWNRESYASVASSICSNIGKIGFLIGTVGSGGSMCGLSHSVRENCPNLFSIGVDTHGSVLFGQKDSKRVLRGLGNSIMPDNLKHEEFNEVHWVSAPQAFYATRKLHREFSIFAGPTSGASFMIGNWIAPKNPDKIVVSVFPDEGWRYLSVYDDNLLRNNGLYIDELPSDPEYVRSPLTPALSEWKAMRWDRRKLADVIGAN